MDLDRVVSEGERNADAVRWSACYVMLEGRCSDEKYAAMAADPDHEMWRTFIAETERAGVHSTRTIAVRFEPEGTRRPLVRWVEADGTVRLIIGTEGPPLWEQT